MAESVATSGAGPPPAQRAAAAARGVFAGTARGAGIGWAVGSCVTFVILVAALVLDAARQRDLPLGARLSVLLLVATWFALVAALLGGTAGACAGALVGTLFPVRRRH